MANDKTKEEVNAAAEAAALEAKREKRIADAEAKVKAAEAKAAEAEEALRLQELDGADREERIATLEAQAAKTAALAPKSSALPTFEYEDTVYRFRYPALNFGGGKKLTAEQIAEDAELCEQLVINGSAAIEEA